MVARLKRIRGTERVEIHRTAGGDWAGEAWRVPVAAVLPRNPRVLRLSEARRGHRAEIARRNFGTRSENESLEQARGS